MDLTVPEGMGGKEAIRRLRELDPQVEGHRLQRLLV